MARPKITPKTDTKDRDFSTALDLPTDKSAHAAMSNEHADALDRLDAGFAKVITSDFTTTGQALVDVTGLTFATAANKQYRFRAVLSTSSSSASGIEVGVQHSGAGASIEAVATGTAGAGAVQAVRVSALNTATAAFNTNGADGGITIEGILTVGANAGNLTIQVLKVTSGTATVRVGSHVEIRAL